MLLTIIAILVLIWLIGLALHLFGALIQLAVVVAAILFVYDVLIRRRRNDKDKK